MMIITILMIKIQAMPAIAIRDLLVSTKTSTLMTGDQITRATRDILIIVQQEIISNKVPCTVKGSG